MNAIPDIADEKWPEIIDRLTLHATCKLRKLAWRGASWQSGGKPPGGVEAADIAAEAVISAINGERTWNQARQPCFLTFLKGIVDSKVSHLVESWENRAFVRLPERPDDLDCRCSRRGGGQRPDEIVANDEAAEKFRTAVIRSIEGDQLAGQLFECFEAGILDRSEIAEVLGVNVSDVDNARKRLARHVEKAQAQYQKQLRKGHE